MGVYREKSTGKLHVTVDRAKLGALWLVLHREVGGDDTTLAEFEAVFAGLFLEVGAYYLKKGSVYYAAAGGWVLRIEEARLYSDMYFAERDRDCAFSMADRRQVQVRSLVHDQECC